jgi:hypothetical protein
VHNKPNWVFCVRPTEAGTRAVGCGESLRSAIGTFAVSHGCARVGAQPQILRRVLVRRPVLRGQRRAVRIGADLGRRCADQHSIRPGSRRGVRVGFDRGPHPGPTRGALKPAPGTQRGRRFHVRGPWRGLRCAARAHGRGRLARLRGGRGLGRQGGKRRVHRLLSRPRSPTTRGPPHSGTGPLLRPRGGRGRMAADEAR